MKLGSISAIIGFLGCTAMGCSSVASKDLFQGGNANWTALERSTIGYAEVNWANASAPFKRYLLIEDGEFLCAIRFVNYLRGNDARPGSFWSSGEETLTSAYEWGILHRANGKLEVVEQGHGAVRFTAPKGFGHLIVSGGYENVRCGKREFGWQYPAGINFSQDPNSYMKLAPTRWEKISEIKLDDPKLVWYSFDSRRERLEIPMDD